MKLRLEASSTLDPDAVYARLVALGRGKDERTARQAMAALVLLLVNHIGDEAVLDEALAIVNALPDAGRRETTAEV